MARLHTRKRGKSKSHKLASSAAKWVEYSKEEVESFVEKLASEGKSEAKIGLVLRDQYGIPSVKLLTGRTISQFLLEKNLAPKYPSDLIALLRRSVNMRRHLKENSRDVSNKIKLALVESKIKRLVKYYRGKKLPVDWKYNPETAALIVK